MLDKSLLVRLYTILHEMCQPVSASSNMKTAQALLVVSWLYGAVAYIFLPACLNVLLRED